MTSGTFFALRSIFFDVNIISSTSFYISCEDILHRLVVLVCFAYDLESSVHSLRDN